MKYLNLVEVHTEPAQQQAIFTVVLSYLTFECK